MRRVHRRCLQRRDVELVFFAWGMCAQVTPCGGNVIGIWNLVSECVGSSGESGSSGSCLITFSDVLESVSGTVTFNPDGTFSTNTSVTVTTATTQSSSCFPDSGPPVCTSPNPRQTCTPWQGGCRCTATSTSGSPGSGTYTTRGSTLTTTGQGSTQSSSAGYCVSGSELTIEVGGPGVDGGGPGAVAVLRR